MRWIEFIRDYAKRHNLKFSEVIHNQEAIEEYKSKYLK